MEEIRLRSTSAAVGPSFEELLVQPVWRSQHDTPRQPHASRARLVLAFSWRSSCCLRYALQRSCLAWCLSAYQSPVSRVTLESLSGSALGVNLDCFADPVLDMSQAACRVCIRQTGCWSERALINPSRGFIQQGSTPGRLFNQEIRVLVGNRARSAICKDDRLQPI